MLKRWIAISCVFALLLGIGGCRKSNDLEMTEENIKVGVGSTINAPEQSEQKEEAPEPQPETEEPKEEIKEEPKEDSKEEPKEEPKEESKEDPKEQSEEIVKEQPKEDDPLAEPLPERQEEEKEQPKEPVSSGEIFVGQGGTSEKKDPIEAVPASTKDSLLVGADYKKEDYKEESLAYAKPYMLQAVRTYLGQAEEKNTVFSPVNIYLALGMLAEITDGKAQQELLTLLGAKDVSSLRDTSRAIWNAHYAEEQTSTNLLASSMWLNDKVSYKKSALQNLAEYYNASSFQGKVADPAYQTALREWLNAQTGGLLKDQVQNVKMDPRMVILLATTVYYEAEWGEKFSEERTAPRTFHSTKGDQSVPFMNRNYTGTYFWGEGFGAATQSLRGGTSMFFIMPDKDSSVQKVLESKDFAALLGNGYEYENRKSIKINFSVPKFDLQSSLDLVGGLNKMGVQSVFDPSVADFSPLTDEAVDNVAIDHAARMKIDEKGCLAAAYTVINASGSAMPPEEEIDFILDRPFIVLLMKEGGIPLFAGIVNQVG